jgi:hypothetical protein
MAQQKKGLAQTYCEIFSLFKESFILSPSTTFWEHVVKFYKYIILTFQIKIMVFELKLNISQVNSKGDPTHVGVRE